MLFMFALICTSIQRGLIIVILAWSGLEVGGTVAATGQVFLLNHSMNVLLGPFFGVVSDKLDRKVSIVIGQGLTALAFLVPLILWSKNIPLTFLILLIIAFFARLGGLVSIGALDGLLQQLNAKDGLRRAAVIANGVRQGFMVAGAGAGGFLIHAFGIPGAFLIASTLSIAVMICIANIEVNKPVLARKSNAAGVIESLVSGIRYMRTTPTLIPLALATSFAFSVGQLGNALLPGFVKIQLEEGSATYGLIDAMWSIGGVLAAFVASFIMFRHHQVRMEYVGLAALGACSMVMALSGTSLAAALTFGLMGLLFSVSKIAADSQLLVNCSERSIGRVRANIRFMTSILGIAIYSAPSFFPSRTSADLFMIWGMVVLAVGLALLLTTKNSIAAESYEKS